MSIQTNQDFEKIVFGDYKVSKKLPFRIAQAPFRKFSKYQREGHWNQKERLKYTVFLGFFQAMLEDSDARKRARIYEMMSDMIITRNPSQCRSHHQKMQKYRTTIADIITSVTQKYEPSVYEEIKEKYTIFIKTLLQNSDKYIRLPTSTSTEKKKDKIRKVNSMKSQGRITLRNTDGEIIAQSKRDKKTGIVESGDEDDEGQNEVEQEKPERFIMEPQQFNQEVEMMEDQINQQVLPLQFPIQTFFFPPKEEELKAEQVKREKTGVVDEEEYPQKEEVKQSQECNVKVEKSDSNVAQNENERQCAKIKQLRRTGACSDDEDQAEEQDGSRGVVTPEPYRPQVAEMRNMWSSNQMVPVFIPCQQFGLYNPQDRINELEIEISQIETNMANLNTAYYQKQCELNFHKSRLFGGCQ